MEEMFRHASLLAQIGLIAVLGLGAMGVGPIGLTRLFPTYGTRRCVSGVLYSLIGLGSFVLLCGILFLGI
jgi:hypothetical protein